MHYILGERVQISHMYVVTPWWLTPSQAEARTRSSCGKV